MMKDVFDINTCFFDFKSVGVVHLLGIFNFISTKSVPDAPFYFQFRSSMVIY